VYVLRILLYITFYWFFFTFFWQTWDAQVLVWEHEYCPWWQSQEKALRTWNDHEGIQSWWRRCIKSWNIYLEMTAGIAASWLSPSLIYTTKGCCWSTIGGSLSPINTVYLGNQLRTCLHLGLFPSGLSLFSRHLLNLIFRPWMGLKWPSPLHWLRSTNRTKSFISTPEITA